MAGPGGHDAASRPNLICGVRIRGELVSALRCPEAADSVRRSGKRAGRNAWSDSRDHHGRARSVSRPLLLPFSQEELRPTIPNGVLCDRNKGYSASSSVRASLCDSFVRLDQHVTDHKLP